MDTTLEAASLEPLANRLKAANAELARRYGGEKRQRQPVHTVYGGAHLFKADTSSRLGAIALRILDEYGGDELAFARAVGLPGADRLPALPDRFAGVKARLKLEALAAHTPSALAIMVHDRVREKLQREPIEDFRIDFEDGYGVRPHSEEDAHADSTAREVAAGMARGTLPPFIGVRLKALNEESRARSIRTLDLFMTALVRASSGALPSNFVVTLPKVSAPEQVAYVVAVLDRLESALGLERDTVKIEVMIETPQAMFNANGGVNVTHLIDAGAGRITAAHFGTYDYTAALNITAAYQSMTHPACDFAKHVLQVAVAGTGVWLSDGATNVMPVTPHRPREGDTLSEEQMDENRAAVHRAWKLHYSHIRHSLVHAYYQGWDLHPGQLPSRYAAVYAFFLDGLDTAADRLRNFIEMAARATVVGEVFDDAATGQGLLNYFLRAVNCGAISEAEAVDRTGLTAEELRSRSFAKILAART